MLLGAKCHQICIKCTNADVRLRTPYDGQKGCPKTCTVVMPVKLDFSSSVGFIYKELDREVGYLCDFVAAGPKILSYLLVGT